MSSIERRRFLMGALASLPLAAGAQTPGEDRPKDSVYVPAGKDRFGESRSVLGGLTIDIKVSSQDTAGGILLIEHTDHRKGGPPQHIHHDQEEWFYVLEGSYLLVIGEQRFDLAPGDSVLAPRGVPHVWAHNAEDKGRLLLAFQPAGQMESFFQALAQAGSAPSPETLRPLFASHGMTIVGPPLAV